LLLSKEINYESLPECRALGFQRFL
jgi:hypothetical protein